MCFARITHKVPLIQNVCKLLATISAIIWPFPSLKRLWLAWLDKFGTSACPFVVWFAALIIRHISLSTLFLCEIQNIHSMSKKKNNPHLKIKHWNQSIWVTIPQGNFTYASHIPCKICFCLWSTNSILSFSIYIIQDKVLWESLNKLLRISVVLPFLIVRIR